MTASLGSCGSFVPLTLPAGNEPRSEMTAWKAS